MMEPLTVTLAIVTLVISVAGAVGGSVWRTNSVLRTERKDLEAKLETHRRDTSAKISELHDKVERVRDKYVRREDLNSHLSNIEKSIDELKAEMHSMTQMVHEYLINRGGTTT